MVDNGAGNRHCKQHKFSSHRLVARTAVCARLTRAENGHRPSPYLRVQLDTRLAAFLRLYPSLSSSPGETTGGHRWARCKSIILNKSQNDPILLRGLFCLYRVAILRGQNIFAYDVETINGELSAVRRCKLYIYLSLLFSLLSFFFLAFSFFFAGSLNL